MDDHEILNHVDDIINELTSRGATEAGRLSAAVKLGSLRQRIAAWISECEEIEAEVGAPA